MKRIVKFCTTLLALLLFAMAFSGCSPQAELKRLAKNLSTYTINASYNDYDQTITAHQRVDFVNNYSVPLKEVVFHLYPNAFRRDSKFYPVPQKSQSAAFIDGVQGFGNIEISSVTVDGKAVAFEIGGEDSNVLIAPFAMPLYPTAKYAIEIAFKVYLPRLNHRFGYNLSTVNLGNWYPIAAVYENGQFDKSPYYSNGDPFYSQTANYIVNLTVPSAYTVAATGSGSCQKQGKTSLFTLNALAVRDFAIVMSKDFKVLSQKTEGVEILYYYYGDEAPENSLQAAVDSVVTYNKLFGSYPYPTLSVVEAGFLHGGMEYPALVIISDVLSGDVYLEVVIHEIAHQWWYAVVGSNQITDAWMDEGLTEYSTTLFYEHNPQYNVTKASRIMDAMQKYLLYVDVYKSLSGELDTSMNRRADKYGEFEYVYMVYVKGHLMFDSLRKVTGDSAFFDALKRYYKQNKFGIAKKADMVGAFESASKKQLGSYFDSWVEGKVQILDI